LKLFFIRYFWQQPIFLIKSIGATRLNLLSYSSLSCLFNRWLFGCWGERLVLTQGIRPTFGVGSPCTIL